MFTIQESLTILGVENFFEEVGMSEQEVLDHCGNDMQQLSSFTLLVQETNAAIRENESVKQ